MVALPMWTSTSLVGNDELRGAKSEDNGDGGREGDDEIWRTQKMGREEMRNAVGAFLLDDVDG